MSRHDHQRAQQSFFDCGLRTGLAETSACIGSALFGSEKTRRLLADHFTRKARQTPAKPQLPPAYVPVQELFLKPGMCVPRSSDARCPENCSRHGSAPTPGRRIHQEHSLGHAVQQLGELQLGATTGLGSCTAQIRLVEEAVVLFDGLTDDGDVAIMTPRVPAWLKGRPLETELSLRTQKMQGFRGRTAGSSATLRGLFRWSQQLRSQW